MDGTPKGTASDAIISPTSTGRRNRARVLRLLYTFGPMARVDLAAAVCTTRATIGQIVQPLLEDGVLHEQDPRQSTAAGGRRARPLWFAREGWTAVGVHLLPGWIRSAAVGAAGDVFGSVDRRFDPERTSQDELVDLVVEATERLSVSTDSTMRGVGIAVPGMVDTISGDVVAVNLMPQLDGLPLARSVAERVRVPVTIDQHPRTQALGDLLFGMGRGHASFASVYTGEALGVGLITEGAPHRGPGGAGGELGHSVVDVHGKRCHCGQRGCWETLASLCWLRERAAELGLSDPAAMTGRRASQLAAGQDPAADRLLGEYAHHIAYGLANLFQLAAPELFLLHGDVVGAGEQFARRLEHEVVALVPRHPRVQPRIRLADQDDDATVRGAASLALFHTLGLDRV